ncbi:prohibitin family protein [Ohtaekwangia koreensis]|uniref:Regulator of protease activity HflC, stomatin/prohibitin superfamily n=1 Tax=Ohtaekwangia koreensis TaxID=688867 RepID=A0A1T5M4N7_9BACT|nr:prohibitin family protein [Ohtaekwangia koreensis]SKC83085.1 Regulator of protease activity HflC, stomatin/prohibitin superfamily [Ohtaekwangia koreensis]
MNNRRLVPFIVIGVIALFVLAGLSSNIFYKIGPSERAVIFYPFGNGLDKEQIIEPGTHMKAPWNDVIMYEVAEITSEENMDINDKNGLPIHVDVSVRYFPMPSKIGDIHEKFTKDYVNRLVIPEVRSVSRQVMAKYTAEEIYSTKRAEVEVSIKSETEKILNANFVNATAVLIRSIKLPDQIRVAIENKLQQEQEALAYQYRLDKEKSEAERKRIAAEGEARANNIVNSSLSDKLLKMRGIEATLELAKSPNSKVVIVGSGGDGMPLILGNN